MAFPYSWESGLEESVVGASKPFQSETDTASKLSISHYTNLARYRLAPHSGAYALLVDNPVADTTAAYLAKTSSLDMAPGATRFLRFYFYLGENFAMGSGDGAALLNILAGSTVIAAFGLRAKSDNRIYAWVARDNSAPDHIQELAIGTNEPPWIGDIPETRLGGHKSALMRWYHVELQIVFPGAGVNNGQLRAWVNDTAVGSNIVDLPDAVTASELRLGYIQFQGAPIGEYVIDDVKQDDARIFMDQPDAGQITSKRVTASEDHPLIGSSRFSISLTGVGTDAVLELYDSDGVPNSLVPIDIIRNTVANERVDVSREYQTNFGLYTILSGTSPQAFINVTGGGVHSHGGLVQRGIKQHRSLP